jgi:peptide deformylase
MLTLVTGKDTGMLTTKTALVADPLAVEIQTLLPAMITTMHKENGIGLAATQIGKSLRLAVAEVEGQEYFWINPEITTLSKEKIIFEEGCLSLPGEYFPIVRSESVTLKYTNEKGLPKKLRATGLLAVVIQHEVDHLDGILICNRYQKQTKIRENKIYGRID